MIIITKYARAEVDNAAAGYAVGGLLSAYGVIDSDGDVVLPGAFDHIKDGTKVPAFYNHEKTHIPIGVSVLTKRPDGLHSQMLLTRGIRKADETALAIVAGSLDALSMGGYSLVGDVQQRGRVRELRKVYVREASITVWGANRLARIETVKSACQLSHLHASAVQRLTRIFEL